MVIHIHIHTHTDTNTHKHIHIHTLLGGDHVHYWRRSKDFAAAAAFRVVRLNGIGNHLFIESNTHTPIKMSLQY